MGRDGDGNVVAPPVWPLYPEPLTHAYIVPAARIRTLPRKFWSVGAVYVTPGERVVVYPSGELRVQQVGELKGVPMLPVGKHWCYIPWTQEQEDSCRPRLLKFAVNR